MASSRSRKIPKPEGSRNGGRGDGTHESRLKKDANGKDERLVYFSMWFFTQQQQLYE